MAIQIISLIVNLAVALAVGLAALGKSGRTPDWGLAFLALIAGMWSACDLLFQKLAPTALFPLLGAGLYLVSVLAASAHFIYMVRRANRENWINKLPPALLAILPLLTQVVFWVSPLHAVLFGSVAPVTAAGLFLEAPWGRLTAFYIFTLLSAGSFLLWDTYLERPRSTFMPLGAVLLGSLIPPIAAVLEFAVLNPTGSSEVAPFGLALACIGYAYYFFQRSPDMMASIDRNAVVEGMDDGWMVLNKQNVVVDMNSAAERMAGLARAQVLGQPVTTVLGGLPNLAQSFDHSQELEMKRSIRSEDGWKYLNIRLSPLTDREQKPVGRLALWHDVTERKLTEDARQRARDEMLVLLNAISSAASSVVDLDDFLSESIYHIIYPFRSQVAAFFLLEEKAQGKDEQKFFLSANLGLPAQPPVDLLAIPASSPLFAEIIADREPLQIEDINSDLRVPAGLRGLELACLLMIPLINQSGENYQVLGCMCLARKDRPVFSPDEIVRLTMISDQIAALIDSDRRRKLAITSTERKRLMRDLHDSVSQKLYGLVTTAEAAQAAIEAGSQVNPTEVLVRIGESARQAVKEMRLFLFQMQPIDMEKDGLISLMHQRLAAVEGRADIKARLRADLADDELALSKQTQIVVYYVAQEALNNVLRHAAAKSVSVTLKQGRRNVILEILDDGCGFDPKKVERGGLGLMNMRERTVQIKGKLQILSKPEKGTKVRITVPMDPSVKPVKHRR
ncbi:MAG TPA: ATP-binding protein [Anaerolineales bacterium]